MTGIDAHIELNLGEFRLDAELHAPGEGITALFGPSGSGKTTLLRCLAGLTRAPRGKVRVNGETWQDDRVFLPPHRRAVGYVFQESSLFSHLSVERNIRYGYNRVPPAGRRIRVDQAVEWLGIGPLMSRMPSNLSGGERQRVAIARALLTSPALLLLDEPMSSLDEASRQEIMPYLARLHGELSIPALLVSHSIREVLRLADHVVTIDCGRVTESGPVAAMAQRLGPGSAGGEIISIIEARVVRHDDAYHLSLLDSAFGPLWAPLVNLATGDPVRLQVEAHDVSLGLRREDDSSLLNQVCVRVGSVTPLGPGQTLVRLGALDSGDDCVLACIVTAKSADALALAPGLKVYARIKGVRLLQ